MLHRYEEDAFFLNPCLYEPEHAIFNKSNRNELREAQVQAYGRRFVRVYISPKWAWIKTQAIQRISTTVATALEFVESNTLEVGNIDFTIYKKESFLEGDWTVPPSYQHRLLPDQALHGHVAYGIYVGACDKPANLM